MSLAKNLFEGVPMPDLSAGLCQDPRAGKDFTVENDNVMESIRAESICRNCVLREECADWAKKMNENNLYVAEPNGLTVRSLQN